MSLIISSSFDAGNIRVVRQDGDSADLEIVQDHMGGGGERNGHEGRGCQGQLQHVTRVTR